MEELLACRVCIATDTKLYHIHSYNLANSYHSITGLIAPVDDGLPQHLCLYCAGLLHKCAAFRQRCHIGQSVLADMLSNNHTITTKLLRKLDCTTKLNPLTTKTTDPAIEIVHIENKTVKEEHKELNIEESELAQVLEIEWSDLKYEADADVDSLEACISDDEPLSDLGVKKRKKRSKKKEKYDEFSAIACEMDIKTEECKKIKSDYDNIDVVVLSKEEQLEDIQARKFTENYRSSVYRCELCYKGFLTEQTFNNHRRQHDPSNGKFACEICFIRCIDRSKLKSHMATTHERRYTCRLCTHVTHGNNQAREHQRWHEGLTYDCKQCGKSFRKSTSYLTHLRLLHPSDAVCEICGDSFLGEFGLKAHKLKSHTNNESSETMSLSSCLECKIDFKSAEALNRHMNTSSAHNFGSHLGKRCIKCGETFDSESSLKEHLKSHRNNAKLVKCTECKKVFSSTRTYSAHFKLIHMQQSVTQRRSLERNFVCETCGKGFTCNAKLVYHQRMHTGEKPYQCKLCPKTFRFMQLMKVHLRTHMDERPYACAACPKAFRSKAAINRHARVHTGDKPYTCNYCGKSFSQSNSMKGHVNTVHLKLPAPYKKRSKTVQ